VSVSFPEQSLKLLSRRIQTLKSEMHHYGQVSRDRGANYASNANHVLNFVLLKHDFLCRCAVKIHRCLL